MLVSELLIVHFTLWMMIITKTNGYACLYSCVYQLFKNSCTDFHHSCQTKTVLSRKHFQQCSESSDCYCNENSAFVGSYTENSFRYQQLDLRQIKKLRVGQPILNFDAAVICRLYVTTMKAMNFQYQIFSIPFDIFWAVCTSLWFEFNARCYWKVSMPKSSWRPTEAGAKPYLSSGARYWTHCFGKTNDFGCSWQVCCCWKKSTLDNVSLQQIFNRIPLLKDRYWALWFISLWLCPISSQWNFCHYENATQQNAGVALDNDCKLPSQIVLCTPSRLTKFPQAAVRTDVARTTTIASRRLRFLRDICSFSPPQVTRRRNYWNSRCYCTFI